MPGTDVRGFQELALRVQVYNLIIIYLHKTYTIIYYNPKPKYLLIGYIDLLGRGLIPWKTR